PACSFNREKYAQPQSVISRSRPTQTEIVVLVVKNLPSRVERPHPAKPYEFFIEDDPCPLDDPTNEAHAEVRLRQQGQAYDPEHKPKSTVKHLARVALAEKMCRLTMSKGETHDG